MIPCQLSISKGGKRASRKPGDTRKLRSIQSCDDLSVRIHDLSCQATVSSANSSLDGIPVELENHSKTELKIDHQGSPTAPPPPSPHANNQANVACNHLEKVGKLLTEHTSYFGIDRSWMLGKCSPELGPVMMRHPSSYILEATAEWSTPAIGLLGQTERIRLIS